MDENIGGIVQPVLRRLDEALGQDYAAVIYGSAARGEFARGTSDVNLLVVCKALDPAILRRLAAVLAGLAKAKQPPPLLFTGEEWSRATDVFPIEVTDMQIAREVIRGDDPVAGRVVEAPDLRRALESELRARLLRLRQAYAIGAADPKMLGEIATGTIAGVVTLFRVALRLDGRPVPPRTADTLAAAGGALGVDTAVLAELWNRRRGGEGSCPPKLFEEYLTAVAAGVRVIDQFTGGGH